MGEPLEKPYRFDRKDHGRLRVKIGTIPPNRPNFAEIVQKMIDFRKKVIDNRHEVVFFRQPEGNQPDHGY
jgi:hypothetical protein